MLGERQIGIARPALGTCMCYGLLGKRRSANGGYRYHQITLLAGASRTLRSGPRAAPFLVATWRAKWPRSTTCTVGGSFRLGDVLGSCPFGQHWAPDPRGIGFSAE